MLRIGNVLSVVVFQVPTIRHIGKNVVLVQSIKRNARNAARRKKTARVQLHPKKRFED